MIKRSILIAAALLVGISISHSQGVPGDTDQTVGVTTSQVVAAEPGVRHVLTFFNSSLTAVISICPAVSRKDGRNIVCTLHGPGSITLNPHDRFEIRGLTDREWVGQQWNAISDQNGATLTILYL